MKRNFKLLVAVVVLAALVMTLASCDVINGLVDKINPKPHEHTYSADWSSDETNHWHAATCQDTEECGSQKSDVAPHTYADGKCSVCGAADPNYTPVCTEHAYGAPVETKAPTCTEKGEKTLTCTVCGETMTQEVAPNGHTEVELEGKAPTCTETGLSKGKKCSVCDTILTAQVEIPATNHNYVEGVCSACKAEDPNYNGPKTYVLDANDLENKAKIDEDGFHSSVVAGSKDFFTIYLSKKTEIKENKKTFEDGYVSTKRIGWNTKTVISEDEIASAIEMNITGTATVKIWWVSGGYYTVDDVEVPRQIAIYDENGNIVTKTDVPDPGKTDSDTDGVKNNLFISELTISKPGKYYLGNVGNSNYYFKVEVVETPYEAPEITGSGTEDDPYVLPELGDYTAAFPGGYDLVFYSYTVNANGYITLSSNWTGTAWLKAGTDIYNLKTNEGNGSVEVFVTSGSTVYFGVADWDEQPNDVPFTVSFEEVTLGSVDPFVGSWKGTVEGWFGSTTYIINIDEDGKGTASADMGYTVVEYDVSDVIVVGTTVMVNLVDEYENVMTLTFEYDATANTLTGGTDYETGVFSPYTGEEEDDPKPEVTYETIIVSGKNTLFFSEAEVTADSATRKLTITEAGVYKFAAGELFVQSITDANGNSIEKDSNYNFYLEAGEYSLTFGMLSMFGISPDFAYSLEVSIYGEEGGEGGEGGEVEENPEFVVDDIKEALVGSYEFDGYSVMIIKHYETAQYLANVWGDGYDLYFTFSATANDDGSYSLDLTYYSRPDFESGTDKVDTVLAYDIVIGGESEEEADPNEALVGFYEFDGYSVGIYYSADDSCYLANVYGEGYDLYFTFEAVDIGEGSYALMLDYFARPDWETGKDEYLDTVLDYSIVITPEVEEEETDPNEALVGSYEFDGYSVMIYYSADDSCYLANVYGEGYDLYFTFEAVDIGEGSYALMLDYFARPDWETGKDAYLDTVLDYSIVITPKAEEEEGGNNDMVDTTLDGTYTFNPEEGQVFTVKIENGYVYVLEDTIGLELSESFAYSYNPMTGMVQSDEGYFYVDVATGDLYYGRGWLLSPVTE